MMYLIESPQGRFLVNAIDEESAVGILVEQGLEEIDNIVPLVDYIPEGSVICLDFEV